MKYYNYQIAPLDEQYLDSLTDTYGIEWTDIDFYWNGEGVITNSIIRELLIEIVLQEVENKDDQEKLIDSIYTNCLDSQFDIDENELKTKQAKEFLNNF